MPDGLPLSTYPVLEKGLARLASLDHYYNTRTGGSAPRKLDRVDPLAL